MKRWQESSSQKQRNASNYKLRCISKWRKHHKARKQQTQIKIWSCVKGECLGMKLRQRRRNESEGVTMEIYPALPGERVPVCVDWDVWEMVLEEQTHPTNRVKARTALPSLFTLFWLDFQRPRILSLKGEAVKITTAAAATTTKTTTLQSMSEKKHHQNKIWSFLFFSKLQKDFFCMKGFNKIPNCSPMILLIHKYIGSLFIFCLCRLYEGECHRKILHSEK